MTDTRATVTVIDPTRRQECLEALGTDTIPVLDLVHADFPGEKNVPIYFIDVDALSEEQISRLTLYLCEKYSMQPYMVKHELSMQKLAVRVDEVKR